MSYDLGIIGGGQLGMMMIEQAKTLGLTCIVLDPSPDCPCSHIADRLIVGRYDDIDKLNELGRLSRVLSYEFENVPGTALEELNGKYRIPQGILPLLDSQDRLREKDNANRHGLETVCYCDCPDESHLLAGLKTIGYPCIYKTRREGYDGHGQVVLRGPEDLVKLKPYFDSHTDGILEQMLSFDYECSAILIRDKSRTIMFPIGQNIHKDGILDLSIVPAGMPESLEETIRQKSIAFMESTGYEGILTIEYFIKGEKFYFNEMAPRPHNSGHYTIEGCSTNQFLELDKFLIGMPLSDPQLLSATLMKNLLGRDMKNLGKLMQIPEAHLHLYHKTEERPLRKLGHITYTHMTKEDFGKQMTALAIEE